MTMLFFYVDVAYHVDLTIDVTNTRLMRGNPITEYPGERKVRGGQNPDQLAGVTDPSRHYRIEHF